MSLLSDMISGITGPRITLTYKGIKNTVNISHNNDGANILRDALMKTSHIMINFKPLKVYHNQAYHENFINNLKSYIEQEKLLDPNVGFPPYYDIYMMLVILKQLDISNDILCRYFSYNMEEYKEWEDGSAKEYVYLVSRWYGLCDVTGIDIMEFIQQYPAPYESMVGLLKLNELNDIDIKLDALKSYHTCVVTQSKNIQKKQYMKYLMIDLYDGSCKSLTYKNDYSNDNVWKCNGIIHPSAVRKDNQVMITKEEFNANFNKMTKGIFDKSPNPELAGESFPWDIAYVSGGLLSLCCSPNFFEERNSDIDIFIHDKPGVNIAESARKVMNWFNVPNRTMYSVTGCVCSIYIPESESDDIGISRYVQVISVSNITPECNIDRFDLTHIKMFYNGNNLMCHYQAVNAIRSFTSTVTNISRVRFSRFVKSMFRGWNVCHNNELSREFQTFGELAKSKNTPIIDETIQSLYSNFYPKIKGSELTFDEEFLIKSVMTKTTPGLSITKDIDNADKLLVKEGKFETGYGSRSYKTFDIDSVKTKFWYQDTFTLASNTGAITLSSSKCVIKNNRVRGPQYDNKYVMRLKSNEPEFNDFLNNLDNNVMFKIKNKNSTTRLLDQQKTFLLHVPSFIVDKNRSYSDDSHIMDNKGDTAILQRDVIENSTVEFSFSIIVIQSNNDYRFELNLKHMCIYNTAPDDDETEPIFVPANVNKPAAAVEYDETPEFVRNIVDEIDQNEDKEEESDDEDKEAVLDNIMDILDQAAEDESDEDEEESDESDESESDSVEEYD